MSKLCLWGVLFCGLNCFMEKMLYVSCVLYGICDFEPTREVYFWDVLIIHIEGIGLSLA